MSTLKKLVDTLNESNVEYRESKYRSTGDCTVISFELNGKHLTWLFVDEEVHPLTMMCSTGKYGLEQIIKGLQNS